MSMMPIEHGLTVTLPDAVPGGLVTATFDSEAGWGLCRLDLAANRCAASARRWWSFVEAVRAVRAGAVEWVA
jgi:hypothetical protein